MKRPPLLQVVCGRGSGGRGSGVTKEKKIVGESRDWETVESEVGGGEKEREKFIVYRMRLGV